LQKRDYKGALGWFQALLENEKANTQIRLRYADTLVLAGSKNEAIKQYRIVADELAESGFMIRAIAINKKIVQLDPSQTGVHQKLAAMNDARVKGRSAAMAKLASAITSDPATPATPAPTRAAPQKKDETRRAPEPPRASPTMSLEDSLAMEFGESSTPASEESHVGLEMSVTGETSREDEEVLELVEEEPEQEIDLDASSPPGVEMGEQGFEIVSEEEEAGAAEWEFESSDDSLSFSEDVPSLESGEASAGDVLQSASASVDQVGEDEEEGSAVEFEIEFESDAAADGKAPLVGIIGEDIDALIDSIIDDVGSSAGTAPPPPAQSTESPGGIPLFSQLSMQEFIDVAVVLERRSVKAGTVIVREGEPGDSMFIVSTGETDATREKNGESVTVATFSDGDFFGEMAVLSGEPRTATVTAVKNTELLELSRENLQKIFSKHPDVEAKIRLAYDERAMGN
ncbi:MAG: cyclic nucleotide-binding domain-containing protein, partial [Vicinamibacteria bacterium]